ncbi:hypothetical protein K7432_005294 [Basidiobolus ranarum]|uniref:Uncharacterized protein n=1 Tax=Basidiobolus ranarum TaxID=34480 RepID=A0ABR2WWS0_9FUNG
MSEIEHKQNESTNDEPDERTIGFQRTSEGEGNNLPENLLNDRLKRLSVVLPEPVSGITPHTAIGNSIQPTKAKEAVVAAATSASKPGRTHQQLPFKSQFLTLPNFRREKSPGVSPESSPKDNTFSLFKKAAQPPSLSTSPNKTTSTSKEEPPSSNSSSTISTGNDNSGHSPSRSKDSSDSSITSQNQGSPLTRTQQKLLLQRQHFLAGDANYLQHPKNQLRLTKETERIQREFIGVQQFENPLTDSLKRVMERKRVEVVRISPSKSTNISHFH